MPDRSIAIIDMRLPHKEIMDQLKNDAEEHGPFRLGFYDTFQAGFAGAKFNENKEVLDHAIELQERAISAPIYASTGFWIDGTFLPLAIAFKHYCDCAIAPLRP